MAEGNGGTSQLVFDVTLDAPVDAGFTVDYETADGTATSADGDFTAVAATSLGFAGTANEVQQIAIDVTTDSKVELDEAISVLLSNIQAGGRDVRLVGSVFAHDGATDPTTEGWLYGSAPINASVGPVSNDQGTGIDAWFIDDNSSALGSGGGYSASPTAAQIAEGNSQGWTLSTTVRATDIADGPNGSPMAYYRDGNKTWQMHFGSEADGDPVVLLLTNATAFPSIGITHTLDGYGSGYHLYELVFDPNTSTADLLVDGTEVISNYAGLSLVQSPHVAWTAGSSADVGQGNFAAVDWAIDTSTASALGTITNDDSATVSIIPESKVEGTGGTTSYIFDVSLSQPVDVAISMTANTQDGSATAADDFAAIAGATVSFAAGSTTSQQVTVDVSADSKVEADEAFDLVLGALASGGRDVTFVGGGAIEAATADVLNDDSAVVSISANDPIAGESTGNGQFTVSIDNISDTSTDVNFTVSGTASNGADYNTIAGPVTIPANQTSTTIDVVAVQDLLLEGNETVTLMIDSVSGNAGITVGTADSDTVTISDDESVSVEFVSTTSGLTEATTTHDLTLRLVGPAGITLAPGVTVSADVIDDATGLADSGSDYSAFGTQTASFTSGAAVGDTQTVTLEVQGDTVVEPGEDVDLRINAVAGPAASVGSQSTHEVSITDDDTITVEFGQAIGSDLELSGAALPQLLITGDIQIGYTVDVDVSVTGGSATAGDFSAPTTLTVAGGNYAASPLDIPSLSIVNDGLVEPDETIVLGNITGSFVSIGSQSSSDYTILNDDSLTVEFSQSNGSDAETAGGGLPELLVTGDIQSGHTVNVSVAVIGGTATASDYTGPASLIVGSGTYTGQAFAIPSLAISSDAVVEPDETIELGNITGAVPGAQNTSDYTILDDDSLLVEFDQAAGGDAESTAGNLPQIVVTGDVQTGHAVSIDSNVTGGTATASDFSQPSTLTVGAGSYAGQSFAIPSLSITDDAIVEPAETIEVGSLTGSAISVGTQSTSVYTIADDDTLAVEFNQATGSDDEANGFNLPTLDVTGDVQVGHNVSIDVSVAGGTASASDFAPPTTLSVGAGTYTNTGFAIPTLVITDDSLVEPIETIVLGNITGTSIAVGPQDTTTYTIGDDDTVAVEFSQTAGSDVEANGGNLPTLLVTGDVQAGHSVSVEVAVTGGTATASDFIAPTTLTVAAGSYVGSDFAIPALAIVDDTITEADESIELGNLSGSAVTVGTQSSTTYTIIDDDTTQENDPPVITELTSSNPDAENKSDDGVVSISGLFDDINVSDVHVVTVDWGDGSALESITVDQVAHLFAATHTYSDGGIFTISVTVDDGNGGVDTESTPAVVQGIGVVDNTLYIIGGDGHDWAKVRKRHGVLHVDLWLDGHRYHHHWHYQSHSHKHFSPADVDAIVVITCDGHDGIDVLASSSTPVLADAGDGHDSIWTAGADDTVLGGSGNDRIRTYGGDDTIDGGDGNNLVLAGSGNDVITTGAGNDCVHSGDGDDLISTGSGNDWIDAGNGNDVIFAGAGNDDIDAGNGNDIVFGGAGNDDIVGGNGRDLIFGGDGNDCLDGGRGADILIGGDGRDVMKGGRGNDLLIGGYLDTDWESAFNETHLDAAIAEWATGDLADTLSILGTVVDDDDKDYLFGNQGCDVLIGGNRDRKHQ